MREKKLDILLLSDNSLNTVGGEQESTKIIIKGIKENYNIGVIQPGEIITEIENVNYFYLTSYTRLKHLIKSPVKFISYILQVRNTINSHQPKIIHTQAQVSFFIVALLKKLRLISNKSHIIHTERGLYKKYNKLFIKLFFFFLKELDTLVTTTKYNMIDWKISLDKKSINLEYIIIENTAGEIFEKFDKNYKKNNSKIVVGFAGRYTDWKNWPLAVEISEKLYNIFGNRLEIKMAIGCLDNKSMNDTEEMYRKLKNKIGNNFEGKINIKLEEMDKFYYDLDLFIMTSNKNSESFGRTLVEAMSRKTVILTTNAGGSTEVVGNKENVLNNQEDLVNRAVYLIENVNEMEREKLENFKRVKQYYSLDNNIDKHVLLYGNIL